MGRRAGIPDDSTDWAEVIARVGALELLPSVFQDPDGLGFTVAGIRVRFGTTTFAFTGTNVSASVTINHDLERVPIYVGVASWLLSGVAEGIGTVRRDTLSDTQFTCRGYAPGYAGFTSSVVASWVAIG